MTHRLTLILIAATTVLASSSQDLLITGVIDAPLTGGTPKAIEFYATADIADLSLYAFGSANNGGGTDGPEFILSGSATNGDFIYIASESTEFNNWFGFTPNATTSIASINGDDAIELFYDATGAFAGSESVIDVFGDINAVPGTWSYLDGWAYRDNGTGPDGSTFTEANWSFSGANALDGETDNASAATPFPTGTYSTSVADLTAPVWSTGYPFIDNTTTTSFDLNGQLDEPGDIYYVVILHNETAPSSAQVVAGTAPGGVQTSGNFNVPTALTEADFNVSGLNTGTDYDVYVVAQDDEGTPNVQATPVQLDFPLPTIAITEFINDVSGSETTDEWIELFNYGTTDVDLENWTISDEDSDSETLGTVSIAAGNYVILAKSKTSFETQWLGGTPDARVVEVGITLTNTTDEIILADDIGRVVWSLAYSDDDTEGRATFLDYADDSSPIIYGSKSAPGVVRNGVDVSGSTGYEDNSLTTDAQAVTSTTGDVGSPLDGPYDQPLPVELTLFKGAEAGSSALISWQTASEINNQGFIVEKSLDGTSFGKIGFVPGGGDSSVPKDYRFEDAHFFQSAFYRLTQVDYDGAYEVSDIIQVRKVEVGRFGVFPNPISDQAKIFSPVQKFNFRVLDLSGRTIIDRKITLMHGESFLGHLKSGSYVLEISDDNFHFRQTIVKK